VKKLLLVAVVLAPVAAWADSSKSSSSDVRPKQANVREEPFLRETKDAPAAHKSAPAQLAAKKS
jgi:hypothetical protein